MNTPVLPIARPLLALLCALIMAFPTVAQPRLSMPTVHDWGTVTASNSTSEVPSIKATIPLTNTGTSMLKVKEVRTSCGCTSAPLDKDSLAPGETTNLNVSLNLPNGNGPIEKFITIFTNASEKTPHILTIKANVQRALQLSSSYIPFNMGVVNTPHIGSITITSNNETPVTITPSTEMVTTTIDPAKAFTLKKGESQTITFTHTPDVAGPFTVHVVLRTDLVGYETIALQGYGAASDR